MMVKIITSKQRLLDSFESSCISKGIIKPDAIYNVMIHETSNLGTEWYLIDVKVNYQKVYCSDAAVLAKTVIRHYHSPLLEKDYRDGTYLWIRAELCQLIEQDDTPMNNKGAKFLLEQPE